MPRKTSKKPAPKAIEPEKGEGIESPYTPEKEKENEKQTLISKLVDIACEQLATSMKFKQPRMAEIRLNEDINAGKVRPALSNRFNVPFDTVVMKGAIETIMAKSDDKPLLHFEGEAEEYKRAGQKVTAAFEKDSADSRGRWAQKDRQAKKMAYLSGRAIFEIYSESKPTYRNVLKNIDHNDFQCEPGGGPYLEDHLFCGVINQFFSKESLLDGVGAGLYIETGVSQLIHNTDEKMQKTTTDEYRNRQQRFQALGLDIDQHDYVGTSMFNLVKWAMEYEGDRYYLLFDPKTKACVRCEKLVDITESNLYPWVSWATEEEAIFWNKAPADTIRPVAEVYRVLVNQMLENIQKRNWNMRAYDPNVFPDPAKLLYTPDGLVRANLKPGMTSVAAGVYELTTPDTTGVTLNAIQWLNSFLGEKTGVTPGAMGSSKEDKVGIYYGNIEQVSERFGLLNKSYTQSWIDLGVRYDWGLYEHLPEKFMVKMIGINGVGWEEVKKSDVEPDFTVRVVSTNATAQENDVKAKKQLAALTLIQSDPDLKPLVNKKWRVEQILKTGYDEEAVRVAMDVNTYGDEMVLTKAAEQIRKVVDGEWPLPLIREATTGFTQKIVDYATDHAEEVGDEIYSRLMIYAKAHEEIVNENMIRMAQVAMRGQALPDQSKPIAPTISALPGDSRPAIGETVGALTLPQR